MLASPHDQRTNKDSEETRPLQGEHRGVGVYGGGVKLRRLLQLPEVSQEKDDRRKGQKSCLRHPQPRPPTNDPPSVGRPHYHTAPIMGSGQRFSWVFSLTRKGSHDQGKQSASQLQTIPFSGLEGKDKSQKAHPWGPDHSSTTKQPPVLS